ncbi:gliding motility-associated C-terminal domain-containing protein, partial [Winogradskyella immobilis]
FSALTGDVDTSGTWTVSSGNATIVNGSFFNPTDVANNDGDNNPLTFNDEDLGDYVFTYTVEGDCATSVDVIITLNDDCIVLPCNLSDVEISRTITPNGDQYNQFFEVTGIEGCGFEINVQIFNRWGAEVFESNNYQNDWSGQAPSGSVGNSNFLPTGTYYYIINLRGSGFAPINGPIYIATNE